MRSAHPIERRVGMEWYASDADGTGGRLRDRPEDFRVWEIEDFEVRPVDADPGAYPHVVFRATLRGWDTNDFARALSSDLGVSRERVSWAGTKDKDAVTTQLFSVRGVDPGALPAPGDADVEVLGRAGRGLRFGDLAGNRFEVRVRDAEAPENADAVTADLRTFGGGRVAVPNYFGHQRFGSRRPVTHAVGLAVVREDWRGAVRAYLGDPSEHEPPETRAARRAAEDAFDGDGNWSDVAERFHGGLRFERSMCHALAAGESYRAALERVPSNLQRLFVNAAQSYVFNRVVSERMERGLPLAEPVAGDVVAFARTVDGLAVPDADRTQRVDADRLRTVRRHCERGRAFVTAPLVGTETTLGDGDPGDVERAVLDEVGLAPADFELPGEFHSTGTRRAVLLRVDPTVTRDPLTLSFALPKGSYATVLCREYLKVSPLAL
ncbi:MAG: tRNA pseudouridine(13) synthase TruD [Halobacteriaceae archaeon]